MRTAPSNATTVRIIYDGRGRASAVQVPTHRLKVVRGADKRREARRDTERTLIGSAPGADLELTDKTVSAIHCEITADTEGFHLRDLGSKNGTRLDGRRIVEAFLEPDDTFEVGNTTIRFELIDQGEQRELHEASQLCRLLGSSVVMRDVYRRLVRAASSDAPVLIGGETGTGKELAADALVELSARPKDRFVVIDCATLTSELAESTLFGHEAGAFTGAVGTHVGAFERAHGGTVFLDEVGELPLPVQAKLLGVLERRELQRVGGLKTIPVDFRLLAATHRELEVEVNRGVFRADLFYRLAVLQVRLPPLRDRKEDIPMLVAHFLEELPGKPKLNPGLLERLYQADYAGNVRELRSAVERAALGLVAELPASGAREAAADDLATPFRVQKEQLVTAFERRYLLRMLEACGGNVSEAARKSGLNRVYLYELMQRHGLGR